MSRYDEPTEAIDPDSGGAGRAAENPFLIAGAGLRGGRYVLERVLGRGGMAAVWLARDLRLERPVAIKVLSDILACDRDYLARFEREARVAAGLTHPNLIRIYDYGAERGRPFLVMEHVGGGDLRERLETGPPPDPARLARELLGALRHIHGAGVLHRDVKPQNVLLARDGGARLTDFGIAQPVDATSLTQTGMVLGTARYLAPEMLEGEAPSERSDLFSLGVVLAEAAEAGEHPASGALTELIESLRARDPRRRPASAGAALEALERPAADRARGARARPAVDRTGGASRPTAMGRTGSARRRLAVAGAAVALIVAGAATSVIAGGGGDDPEPAGAVAASEQAGGDIPEGDAESVNGDGEADAEIEAGSEPEGQPEPDAANGFELNDRGFALINDGQPHEAVPILERAVDALRGSGEITYAYALFNLGHALRLAGRPEEAIPILEARLEIPDQQDVVRRELDAALAAAGMEPRGGGNGAGRPRDDDD